MGLSELAFRVESALIRREATIGSRASSDENQRLVSAFRAGLERFKHELTNLTEYQRAQVVPTEMSNPADERVSESLATLSDQINELGSIVGTSSTEDEAA